MVMQLYFWNRNHQVRSKIEISLHWLIIDIHTRLQKCLLPQYNHVVCLLQGLPFELPDCLWVLCVLEQIAYHPSELESALCFHCQNKICPTVSSLGALIVASFCGFILLVVLAFIKSYGLVRLRALLLAWYSLMLYTSYTLITYRQ